MTNKISVLAAFLLASITILIFSHAAYSLSWDFTYVRPGGQITVASSLALDKDGNPYYLWVGTQGGEYVYLNYTTPVNGVWPGQYEYQTIETLGHAFHPAQVFGFPTIQIDSAGNPAISASVAGHPDSASPVIGALVNGAWQLTPMDHEAFASCIDGNDMRHLIYSGTYGYYDGNTWTYETVPVTGSPSSAYRYFAIDTDFANNPYIVCGSSTNVRFAYRDGQDWVVETVGSGSYVNFWNLLAVDGAGNPNVVYTVGINQNTQIMYAWKDIAGWHTELLGQGNKPDIKVDKATGAVYVAFVENGNLILCKRINGAWQTEIVATDSNGQAPNIALSYDGTSPASMIAIVYQRTSSNSFDTFGYGTAMLVPEPGTIAMLLAAVSFMAGILAKRKNR